MNGHWHWPNGAAAAVSLTYDDGVPSHLDQAIPDLEAAGFRGTFYPTIGYAGFIYRLSEWRHAFERGHEIGNHTIDHPCGKELTHYSPHRMAAEIRAGADWLDENVGVDSERSFAYPCGDTRIGYPPCEDSYAEAVRRCHPFARTTELGVNAVPEVALRPLHIKGSLVDCPRCTDADGLIRLARDAAQAGGWVAFGFHGIGDRWIPTTRPAHQELIEHLTGGDYWVAPLKNVARYIVDAQADPADA